MDAYSKSAKLSVAAIKSQSDVLALAQRLELGAANAEVLNPQTTLQCGGDGLHSGGFARTTEVAIWRSGIVQ